MSLEIRELEADDYLAVKELYKQVAKIHIDARHDIFKNGESLSKRLFNYLLTDKDTIFLVAYKEKELIGVSVLELKLPEELGIHIERQIGFIDTFCIDEKHKKHGYGQELFNKTIEVAKTCDVDTIELMVWEFNKDAIKFYEKMGLTKQSMIMELNI